MAIDRREATPGDAQQNAPMRADMLRTGRQVGLIDAAHDHPFNKVREAPRSRQAAIEAEHVGI